MSAAVATADVRRVEVRPPSPRVEFGNVVRFSMVVLIGVWMFLATDSATFRDGDGGARHLLPFQSLIQDRPPLEQRMFRELQEGLLEAEARRASARTWPSPPVLAADGIPPFAADPTRKGGAYVWHLTSYGAFVNYLGLPQRAGAPAWLVLIQEPEPGAPPDPAREDEEHHRLLTGEMLHVSTWVRADSRAPNGTIRAPQAEGWTQLYAVGPSLSPPPSPPPSR
ncbi:MAG: hypothetical protein ACRD2I_22555 [Vicinamibacterales bacterium]